MSDVGVGGSLGRRRWKEERREILVFGSSCSFVLVRLLVVFHRYRSTPPVHQYINRNESACESSQSERNDKFDK